MKPPKQHVNLKFFLNENMSKKIETTATTPTKTCQKRSNNYVQKNVNKRALPAGTTRNICLK